MEEHYPRIEAYLNKELNTAEKAAFEAECAAKNSSLAKAMAYYLSAKKAADEVRRDKLKARYRQLDNRQKKQPTTKRWLAIAASIALLVSAYFLLPKSSSYDSSQQLADAYFQQTELPEVVTKRGDNTVFEQQLKEAQKALKAGDYDTAMSKTQGIPTTNPLYAAALRLQGITSYQQQKYEAASTIFSAYLALGEGTKEEVLWLQALAYLQTNEADKALTNLNKIIQADYSNAAMAKELKMEIERLK